MDQSLESHKAEEYVASVVTTDHAPLNIPVGLPTDGYQMLQTEQAETENDELSMLEDQAHAQKVLLSSDAMRYFIVKVAKPEDRISMLDMVVAKARVSFPTEDGWIVMNLSRMESILDEVNAKEDEKVIDGAIALDAFTAPLASGSLAEAIVMGNVTLAYEMISNRPMVALADAASDLSSALNERNGGVASISTMLRSETAKLTTQQLEHMIDALTSALDGTYTNEMEAVKMAIAKAVQSRG